MCFSARRRSALPFPQRAKTSDSQRLQSCSHMSSRTACMARLTHALPSTICYKTLRSALATEQGAIVLKCVPRWEGCGASAFSPQATLPSEDPCASCGAAVRSLRPTAQCRRTAWSGPSPSPCRRTCNRRCDLRPQWAADPGLGWAQTASLFKREKQRLWSCRAAPPAVSWRSRSQQTTTEVKGLHPPCHGGSLAHSFRTCSLGRRT